MPYYPEQTMIMGIATVRRERKLPPHAIGEVLVNLNAQVDPATPVLRGAISGDFVILDALRPLGLKRVEDLNAEMLQVQVGEVVDEGQPILQISVGRRIKALESPIRAIFARLDGSRVILQSDPIPVEVLALCPGIVTSVREADKAVLVETIGALVQGVWGNGKSTYAQIALEPDDGLEAIQTDEMIKEYSNAAMVLRNPIKSSTAFAIAAQQQFGAIIAPSMHSSLRENALRQNIPIILTEGFGEMQMSEIVYNLLRGNLHRTAGIDAIEPSRWSPDRPEIVIPLASGGSRPRTPEKIQPLIEGGQVRITRAPYFGMTGRVRKIPDAPRVVENGLRLAGAEVQLPDERLVFVPLANLEMLGRPVDAAGKG